MKKPKNATHELNGVYYKHEVGSLYTPYSKITGRLTDKSVLFTGKNVPISVISESTK